MMAKYICSHCSYEIGLETELKNIQKCPLCGIGTMVSTTGNLKMPGKNQIVTPDNQRNLVWSLENIDNHFGPAVRSIFGHSLLAMQDMSTNPKALEFMENSCIHIINSWMKKEDKKDFDNGWVDSVVMSTIHMSRYHRFKNEMKLNENLEKAFLVYLGGDAEEVNRLENEGWK